MKKRTQRVEFENGRGQKLSARIEQPLDGHVRAWAIFAHCFTCSKDLRAVRSISSGLNRHGIAVLNFDFTGLGRSEGSFAETTFATDMQDLMAAVDYLEEHHRAPALLVGHSLGGAAVLHTAHKLPSVKAVATIGAPFDPIHVTDQFTDYKAKIEEDGAATVKLAGRDFTITKAFVESLRECDPAESIGSLKRALLVMHSPLDDTVGISNASKIFGAAKHPKSFVSLDGADHLITRNEDGEYAGEVIANWAERYLPGYDREEHEPELDGAQVAVKTGRAKFHTDIRAGFHGLVADEPTKLGGTDHGPSPYDLLLASLGACTSMTLRMYADRKELPVESIEVRLSHAKVHKTDAEGIEDKKSPKIDQITREIVIEGDLTEQQRERMLQIADRCPVHRTLHSEIDIQSKLVDD